MNFLSIVPIENLQSMITSALLQSLTTTSMRSAQDTVPYQLYLQQQGGGGCNVNPRMAPPAPPTIPSIPNIASTPRIHSNNLWY